MAYIEQCLQLLDGLSLLSVGLTVVDDCASVVKQCQQVCEVQFHFPERYGSDKVPHNLCRSGGHSVLGDKSPQGVFVAGPHCPADLPISAAFPNGNDSTKDDKCEIYAEHSVHQRLQVPCVPGAIDNDSLSVRSQISSDAFQAHGRSPLAIIICVCAGMKTGSVEPNARRKNVEHMVPSGNKCNFPSTQVSTKVKMRISLTVDILPCGAP